MRISCTRLTQTPVTHRTPQKYTAGPIPSRVTARSTLGRWGRGGEARNGEEGANLVVGEVLAKEGHNLVRPYQPVSVAVYLPEHRVRRLQPLLLVQLLGPSSPRHVASEEGAFRGHTAVGPSVIMQHTNACTQLEVCNVAVDPDFH